MIKRRRPEMKEETITFNVMLNGYFVTMFKYSICPQHPISERSPYNFVVGRLPSLNSLKGKRFEIRFKGDNKYNSL